LVNTAAGGDMCLHLLMIVLDGCHLSYNDLSLGSQQQESVIETSDEGLHFIFYTPSSVPVLWFILL